MKNGLEIIIDLPQKVFENADLDTTIILINNKYKNTEVKVGQAINEKISIYKESTKSFFMENEFWQINLNIEKDDISILEKMLKNTLKLGDNFEVSQGYIPYRRSDLRKKYGKEEGDKIVDNRLWHSTSKINSEYKQEIQGRDLKRYSNTESSKFINYGKHLAGYVNPIFFKSPRILVMEVTRGNNYKITATYIEKEFYNTPSIINIIHQGNNKEYLKYILGLINSKLFTFYHLKQHSKSHAVTSIPKILVREVRNLLIPNITKKAQQPIINLVTSILAQKQADPKADTSELETAIDALVYDLYDLTEAEIELIEKG
jgi:hypothetical protein